jgi:integrase
MDDGVRGIRDLAILGLMATTGLRRGELVSLNLDALDPDSGAIKLIGKGRKARVVYARNRTRQFLLHWLELRGDDPGPLFTSLRKGETITMQRLSGTAIYRLIEARAKAANLKKMSPHDFRRMFIGNMLDMGIDSTVVAALTGHSSVDMVKRYDRRPEKVKADAVDKLDLPI